MAGPLTLKQRLALARWQRHRRHIFRAEIAALTAADIAAAAPDHLLVTGDLANAGLPAEFQAAKAWLSALGDAPLAIVPGNHDALAPGTWEAGGATLGLSAPPYPWCRRVGPLALIGLSSAVPTLPLLATGRLGAAQIAAAERMLAETGADGLCRVVLVHHPPGATTSRRRALGDRHALLAALSRAGAELVLYGHNHRAEQGRIGAAGILALGAPSAAADPKSGVEPAGWYAIAITGSQGAWQAAVTLRRIGPDGRFTPGPTETHAL